MRKPVLPRAIWMIPALILASVTGCAGAGSQDLESSVIDESTSVLLDSPPSGVHAGIYVAGERGYDTSEGLTLRVRRRRAGSDVAALVEREKVDAAVMDIHALAAAREEGHDLVGVMAVIRQPLFTIYAREEIDRPRDLAGRRVGVGSERWNPRIVRAMVQADGGQGRDVRITELTRQPVAAIAGGSFDAVQGQPGVEGVVLTSGEDPLNEFRPEDHGAPRYPGLVLVVSRQVVEQRPEMVRGLISALQRGYREAQVDPESAVTAILARERRLERETLLDQIAAVSGSWTAGTGPGGYGSLDPGALSAWAGWVRRYGILGERPDIDRAFAPEFVGAARNP